MLIYDHTVTDCDLDAAETDAQIKKVLRQICLFADWSEMGQTEQDIKYYRPVLCENGIQVYYDYGADYYFFVNVGLKVHVYFNLHKKVFSVKAMEGPNKGRVIAHTDGITLSDCQFKVSEAGRQRVLKEKRKNVHAGVIGRVVDMSAGDTDGYSLAYYNPYKVSTFVCGNERLFNAGSVILKNKQIFFKK